MRNLIVDTAEWIPGGISVTCLVRSEIPDIVRRREWFERHAHDSAEPFVVVERVRLLMPCETPEIIVVRDQIANLDPTLTEAWDAAGWVQFPEMGAPYAEGSLEKVSRMTKEVKIGARAGCVVGVQAPELLTPAECRALHILGGDAVCRWMHLETRWAAALGRKVFGVGVSEKVVSSDIQRLLLALLDG